MRRNNITTSFFDEFNDDFSTLIVSFGNNDIKKNVIKLIKIYNRIGAKKDKRFPDKYSLVKAAGLKNK